MPPRAAPTHFLCLPLVSRVSRPQLARSLAAFTADVTSPDSFALPEQAVRPLGTLHLTLGVMTLTSGNALDRAIALLKSLVPSPDVTALSRAEDGQSQLVESSAPPLNITLKGLHSMQPPSRATVLYAPPADENGRLMQLCQHLRTAFQDAGFMEKEDRPLLLHATVVNTIYVKASGPGRGRKNERLTIDARDIITRYDDYMWMQDVPIDRVAICKMGAKEQPDGEVAYEAEAEVEFC